MFSRVLKKPDIFVVFIIGLTLIISVCGVIWKWPFAMQFLALLRFVRWSLTAIYASVPIFVLGYWFARKIVHYHFNESPTWSILIAWTMGSAVIIALGILLLGVGLYSVWVWILLALFFNLGVVCWLIYQRWQPIIKLWRQIIPGFREDFLGEMSGFAKTWNVCLLVIVFFAFLHALIPPNTYDELNDHLVLPKLWGFQHHWWINIDNYHLAFPANMEIVWGYALAVGGPHLPRLMTLIFGILTIGGMQRWLKDSGFDPWTRGISLVFFLVSPLAMVMLSINYVEWPLFFFIFLGWRTSKQHLKTANQTYITLTAISWGIGLGVKYTAVPIIGLLGFEWILHILSRFSIRRALTTMVIVLTSGFIFSGPWLMRNYSLTKDPIYPLGQMIPFQQSQASKEHSVNIDSLARYENLSGLWRWHPWLYYATVDRTSDHRMHPGWLFLHWTVILFGWKFRRSRPWFPVLILSGVFFYFTPSPRVYFPLMGLIWIFLPHYLKIFSQRRGLRVIVSGLILLFAIPSLSLSLHFWFMAYNRACQDYLIGLMDDETFLKKDGLITPVMEWIRKETPPDSHVWVWCDDKVFYFDRWVRPSSRYDLPAFLNIVRSSGAQELSHEIKKDRIDYIVVNTSRCSLPLKVVKTDTMSWSVPTSLQEELDIWIEQHLRLIGRDRRFGLYQIIQPVNNSL